MKRKIKQAASLALVFLLLGGCAGVEKNIRETQTTAPSTAEKEETTLTDDVEELIEKATVSQSEETAKNTVSSKMKLPKRLQRHEMLRLSGL